MIYFFSLWLCTAVMAKWYSFSQTDQTRTFDRI